MTSQSRLTINVNCSYTRDWNKTREFLRKLNPYAVVAVIDNMSNRNRIYEIKQDLPNAKIVARCIIVVEGGKQLDGGMHLAPQGAGDTNHYIVSPGNFLNTYGELGQNGISLSYMNEPMITNAQPADIARQVQHMIETIGLATQRGISLTVGNWGVGHQLTEQFDDVIDIVGKQRNLHRLGIHAYAPIDLTKCLDVIVARCKARNLAKPRIGITEFGWDTSGPGDPLNGYKTQPSVNTGVKFGNWEIEAFNDVYLPYIEGDWLEFLATFGWGYAASFPSFDVEPDTDWQSTILDASTKGLLSVSTQPVQPSYTIPPIVPNSKYVVHVPSEFINVRKAPIVTTTAPLATLKTGDIVIALEEMVSGGEYWIHVNNDTDGVITDGWISMQGGAVRLVAYTPPVIPLPPPALPPVTEQTVYLMTAKERAELLGYCLAITNLIISLQEQKVSKAA